MWVVCVWGRGRGRGEGFRPWNRSVVQFVSLTALRYGGLLEPKGRPCIHYYVIVMIITSLWLPLRHCDTHYLTVLIATIVIIITSLQLSQIVMIITTMKLPLRHRNNHFLTVIFTTIVMSLASLELSQRHCNDRDLTVIITTSLKSAYLAVINTASLLWSWPHCNYIIVG